jgi:hypothetical protein
MNFIWRQRGEGQRIISNVISNMFPNTQSRWSKKASSTLVDDSNGAKRNQAHACSHCTKKVTNIGTILVIIIFLAPVREWDAPSVFVGCEYSMFGGIEDGKRIALKMQGRQ